MDESYRVLARKYRPQTFAEIVGQDAMVRVLRNAFDADRIAHAFIMTGVRGVGKTTTARLIAKGLNCIGAEGDGGPTTEPCSACEHCLAIAEGRHVDVLEMDAASRTGVGDVREIIESVPYRAASARYKIYIIDEVHMLSNSAFNALLKTLEEPPEHVKFVFATTEIRSVPVTVLSRCQRFDLRRIPQDLMVSHLKDIAGKENARISESALALIVRAAEGSVRDAISLLDQAISLGSEEIGAVQIREMLSLADRGRILDLLEMVMKGDTERALAELRGQYSDGVDPQALLRELAESVHWVSVLKFSPVIADDPSINPDEKARGLAMAKELHMSILARAWQMLVKSLDEIVHSPSPIMAAEMAVIRLTHVADLPTPQQLAKMLDGSAPPDGAGPSPPASGSDSRELHPKSEKGAVERPARLAEPSLSRPAKTGAEAAKPQSGASPQADEVAAAPAAAKDEHDAAQKCRSYEGLLEFVQSGNESLRNEMDSKLEILEYSFGRITARTKDAEPDRLREMLKESLASLTSAPWEVVILEPEGEEASQNKAESELAAADSASPSIHPLVQSVLDAFPGTVLKDSKSSWT